MPQRGIETGLWSHVDFCGLSPEDKLLFLYLVTSFRGNAAGLYRVTLRQIAFDTGLCEHDLEDSLQRLSVMDIEWEARSQTIWVKRFLAHQAHSPQFLKRVGVELAAMRHYPDLVMRYIEFNTGVPIPYQYPIYALPPSGSVSETESVSESETESDDTAPSGALTPVECPDMTPLEDELRNLKGWAKFSMDDRAWLEELVKDYPSVLPVDVRDCRDYWLAKNKPHTRAAWKSRFRNWLKHKQDGFGGGNGPRQGLPGNRPGGAFKQYEAEYEK